MSRSLRVAVVGAGPAGVYAADILTKSDLPEGVSEVTVDLIERDPTPFGLIRYGVAPDHPRIKEIIKALKRVGTICYRVKIGASGRFETSYSGRVCIKTTRG